MPKEDITGYTMDELSLRVFNTQHLYNLRGDWPTLVSVIQSRYEYTGSQLEVLEDDVIADREEQGADDDDE